MAKAASYAEVKISGGSTTPAYIFNLGVKNTTEAPLTNVKVRETIPKAIASDVSQITFKESPTVVNPDPVVEWTVDLNPGEEKKFVYFVTKLADPGAVGSFDSYVKTLPKPEISPAAEQPAAPASETLGTPAPGPKYENPIQWLLAAGGVVGLIIIGVIIAVALFGVYWFFLRHK